MTIEWQSAARLARPVAYWGARAAAAALAATLAMPLALFVVTGGEGVQLSGVSPAVSRAIEERAQASSARVGALTLRRGGNGRSLPFHLDANDLAIKQNDGSVLLLPSISIRLSPAAMLAGRPQPTFVEIAGASLSVKRAGGGLRFGGTLDLEMLGRLARTLSSDGAGVFEGAILDDFDLLYTDEDSGARLTFEGTTATVGVENNLYSARLSVPFRTADGGGAADLSLDADLGAGRLSAALFLDRAPAGELLQVFLSGGSAFRFDAPVSGTVIASGTLLGGPGDVDFLLTLGEGEAGVGNAMVPLSAMTIEATHDIMKRTLTVRRLDVTAGGHSGTVSGAVGYDVADGGLNRIRFEAQSPDFEIAPSGFWEAPITLTDAALSGEFMVPDRTLAISSYSANAFGAFFSGTGAAVFSDAQFPHLTIDYAADGALRPEQVLHGWPIMAAGPAREWVKANFLQGEIAGLTGKVELPPDAWGPYAFFEKGKLDISFLMQNVTAQYAPGMAPVTGVSGTGHIKDNAASFVVDSGKVRTVEIDRARVTLPRLVPKGAPIRVEASVQGPLGTALSVLDDAPGRIVTAAGFAPADFGGTASADLVVTRPLLAVVPFSDYTFAASGEFAELSLEAFGPGVSLEGGVGRFKLRDDLLTVDGRVAAQGVPATFRWEQELTGDRVQHVVANTRLDARSAGAFGVPLRRFLRGAVDARIKADGYGGAFRKFEIEADLTPASLFLADGRMIKREGSGGGAKTALVLDPRDETVSVENMWLSVPGANIEGNARFLKTGALVDLELPRFFVEGVADVSMRVKRDDRRLSVSVLGDYLDAGPLIDRALKAGDNAGALPGAVDIDVNLASVGLKAGTAVRDFQVSGHYDGSEMASLDGRGVFSDGGAFEVTVTGNAAGLGKDLFLRTDRFGKMLEGLFGLTSVVGGEARLSATLLEAGPIAGTISAENIVLRDMPTVARLLSIGSLDGLANVLNGEGLFFETLDGDVQLDAGELRLVDARLTGSALGLSANGLINLESEVLDLHGAVAPAYRVNSVFGSLPGLGNLFVSRDGEGIFAFSYRVSGPMSGATVTVNTLSALAPGIFRRMFEPVLPSSPSTSELLEAAEEAAGDEAARDFLSTPELLREYERRRAASLRRNTTSNDR